MAFAIVSCLLFFLSYDILISLSYNFSFHCGYALGLVLGIIGRAGREKAIIQ